MPRVSACFILMVTGVLRLQAAQIIRGPYLQSAGHDRMTICWRTDTDTSTDLRWGTDVSVANGPATDPGTRTDHAITLTGLNPATRYYYRVQGTPATGDSIDTGGSAYWFETAPASGTKTPMRFWVVGDSGYNYQAALNSYTSYLSVTALQGKQTDAFLMLGDNAYGLGSDTDYQTAVFNRYATLLQNTPVWAAFGNHETYTSTQPNFLGHVPYDDIFRHPTAGECGGVPSGSERYFSFNHGNVHFICLDTISFDTYNDAPGEPYGMVDWLIDDLKACSSDWIIAYMHYGPYTKGKKYDSDLLNGMAVTRNYVIPTLESYGVDLVLNGHSHVYERSGLIDGHYGMSNTWNEATMRKWPGNGSDLGYVNSSGTFITGGGGGPYQKPAATARSGTVYAVVGASSLPDVWVGGSNAIVNPTPHPVHQVSLLVEGGLVVEIDGNQLKGQYLDVNGTIRDDFTLWKGSKYQVQGTDPAYTPMPSPGVAFSVSRTGATSFSDNVAFSATALSGDPITPTSGSLTFSGGDVRESVAFTSVSGEPGAVVELQLQPSTRSVQPGAAPRAIYQISGTGSAQGTVATAPPATSTAADWYASYFGSPPSSQDVWSQDLDGDGIPLLIEYATGGRPNARDLPPSGTIEANEWVYRYVRASGRTDVVMEALISTDLQDWQPAGAWDTSDGVTNSLGEPRKISLPLSGPRKFIKLSASLQP